METLLSPLRELDEYNQLKIAVEKGVTPVNVIGSMSFYLWTGGAGGCPSDHYTQ